MQKKLSWEDVMPHSSTWGETYANKLLEYMKLVKRMGYKYFIWNGQLMELKDTMGYLSYVKTNIPLEEL